LGAAPDDKNDAGTSWGTLVEQPGPEHAPPPAQSDDRYPDSAAS
jgi:hypothetical protein